METVSKRTFAILVAVMLCACAVTGVAYAVFFAKSISPGTGEIGHLSVTGEEGSGHITADLFFETVTVGETTTTTVNKDMSDLSIKGTQAGQSKVLMKIENKTNQDFILSTMDLDRLVRADCGILLKEEDRSAGKFILPVSALNGLSLKMTFIDADDDTKKAYVDDIVLNKDGTMLSHGDFTSEGLSQIDSGKSVHVTVEVKSLAGWNPMVDANAKMYGQSSFDLTYSFGHAA